MHIPLYARQVAGWRGDCVASWLQNKQCQGRNQHSVTTHTHTRNTKAEISANNTQNTKPYPLASTFIIRWNKNSKQTNKCIKTKSKTTYCHG